MADLFLGETMTRKYRMESDGSAHTITNIGFRPDYIVVYNHTKWGTVSELIKSEWFRDMPAGDALQWNRIVDNGSASEHNTVLEQTNGITLTTNAAGVDVSYSAIGAITGATAANPVVITDAAHGLSDGDTVRLTQLGGMIELNNRRFRVNNAATNTFELQDAETRTDIDGSNFTAYTSGGQWNKLNRVDANRDVFDAETFDVILGSAIIGSDSDELFIVMCKFGTVTDLGDVA